MNTELSVFFGPRRLDEPVACPLKSLIVRLPLSYAFAVAHPPASADASIRGV